MEASSEKIRLGETERGRGQKGSREETKRVGEEETKGEKVSGGKESSKEIGNLEQGKDSGKVRSGG